MTLLVMKRMSKMSNDRCSECRTKLRNTIYRPYCKKCVDRLYREAIAYLGEAHRLSMPKKDIIEFYLRVKKEKSKIKVV